MKRHYPLHIHISTLFVLLILLISGVVAGLAYQLSRNMLEATAVELSERISREKLVELQHVVEPAEMAVNLLTHDAIDRATNLKERQARLGFLCQALENSTALSSIYVGYGTGDFFLVRRLGSDADRMAFSAPGGSRYLVQSVEHGTTPARGRYLFLDSQLHPLRDDDKPAYAASYDPRKRPWYKDALATSGQIKTPPYLFFSDRKVGMTLAARARQGEAVAGADIRLETLGVNLARQKVTPGTRLVLTNPQGLVLAHEDPSKLATVPAGSDAPPRLTRMQELGPVLARLSEPAGYIQGDRPYSGKLAMDDGEWRISIHPLLLKGAQPMYLVMAIPEKELLGEAIHQRTITMIATALIMLLAVPVAWGMARAISRDLRKLAREAEDVRRFDFTSPIEVSTAIKEVHQLALTMDGMKRTIHHFLDISRAIAGEEHFSRLLPLLLKETLATADADAGILYLADEDSLSPSTALRNDGTPLPVKLAPCSLTESGPLVTRAVASGQLAAAPLEKADSEALGLSSLPCDLPLTHGVAVPLLSRQHQLVGVLLFLNSNPIEDARLSFITALSGSAAISLETRSLIQAQKELFHAFIQVIAAAIDAKSPYTGGHCARVPELTLMLARAAKAEGTGPFKDFHLNEAEQEALYVAAWLHDCGKVTVPEYVVDKATRLETLYDRIHEIRMRFEVLKRDAEIACLKAIAAGADAAAARGQLAADLAALDQDFAFVAACNRGGEYMAPEARERLKEISRRTWQRTLDDRLGVSQEEGRRMARTPAVPLPVTEALLADKPEHRVERQAKDRMPADNPWGFRMAEPELLYDRGELHNLTLDHGTLTEEERYRIDGHIVQTVIMLDRLPFPRHLRQVPEMAGGHHEKMDGTGYPRRLKGEDMSLTARMIAIADIFEALTAEDRPYKPGKKLSEAVRIMAAMARDGHIDPALFDLFLKSGIYRDYAERFMRAEHVDEVNVQAFLNPRAAGKA